MNIGQTSLGELKARLMSEGIGLQLGDFHFRVQSPIDRISQAVRILYADHPLQSPADFSDFRIRLDPAIVRTKPAVVASVNGEIWHTWPRRLTVAAMEWICSWCFFRGADHSLALHAAAAAIPGSHDRAIVFPGNSGAGKSTLASTLMMCDWELLSDEISLFDLEDLHLTGLGRPTILKGKSLELMSQRYGSRAIFGPAGKIVSPKSRIAHLRPTAATVRICGDKFQPTVIVFPNRQGGESPKLEPVSPGEAFRLLSQYGINYRLSGRKGFDAAIGITRRCPAFRITYDDAADAERLLRTAPFVKADYGTHSTRVEVDAGAIRIPGPATVTGVPLEEPSAPAVESNDAADRDRERSPARANETGVNDVSSVMDTNEALSVLVSSLRHPAQLAKLTLPEWDEVVLVAKHTQLLSRLAFGLSTSAAWNCVPERVRSRLSHEIQLSQFNAIAIRFELDQLERILGRIDGPIVLLKGAAYLKADLPWARGRQTSDIDLLVAEDQLPAVQSALSDNGYETNEELSQADCRYYRRWLHELPPFRHPYRLMEVDVHFRLLPMADPRTFPVENLIERAEPIDGGPFRILDPVDRVLHAILNLAHLGEFRRGFRDLSDIGCMIETPSEVNPLQTTSSISSTAFDWETLARRTEAFGLADPVAMTLLLAGDLLTLSVPEGFCEELTGRSEEQLRSRWLYRLMRTAAMPEGPSLRSRKRRLATWAMEHYPLPKMRTWLDPLTWTKRVHFLREG